MLLFTEVGIINLTVFLMHWLCPEWLALFNDDLLGSRDFPVRVDDFRLVVCRCFESRLSSYTGDDPLDLWDKWVLVFSTHTELRHSTKQPITPQSFKTNSNVAGLCSIWSRSYQQGAAMGSQWCWTDWSRGFWTSSVMQMTPDTWTTASDVWVA